MKLKNIKSLFLFYGLCSLMLFGASPNLHAKTENRFLPLLSCDFKPQSRILFFLKSDDGVHTQIHIQRMKLNQDKWQITKKFQLPLSDSALDEMVNGTVWSVPHGRHWYTFQDLTSSKERRFVYIEIRSRKTGKMVEWIECHDPQQSLLRKLMPNQAPLGKEILPLMKPALSAWFYRISQ